MNNIRKLITKLFGIILPFVDRMAYLQYFNQPFTDLPKSNLQIYHELAEGAERNTYSIEDVDFLEKKKWLCC